MWLKSNKCGVVEEFTWYQSQLWWLQWKWHFQWSICIKNLHVPPFVSVSLNKPIGSSGMFHNVSSRQDADFDEIQQDKNLLFRTQTIERTAGRFEPFCSPVKRITLISHRTASLVSAPASPTHCMLYCTIYLASFQSLSPWIAFRKMWREDKHILGSNKRLATLMHPAFYPFSLCSTLMSSEELMIHRRGWWTFKKYKTDN